MLVWLDAVPTKQSIEAFAFDARMGCRFSDLPVVVAQDFMEVTAGNLPTTSLLRLSPRECT